MSNTNEIKDQKLMSIKFSTWARTECSSCFQEFEVTRSEPKSFKNNSEIICSECKDYSRAYKDGFETGQQQYKSIVKKVDPDNLPDFEVLILDQKSELYSTGLFIENQRVVGFLNSKHEITRYIEIKDIINLLEDSK